MKYLLLIIILTISIQGITQNNFGLELFKETAIKLHPPHELVKGKNEFTFVGYFKQNLVFKYQEYNKLIEFYLYDESSHGMTQIFSSLSFEKNCYYFNIKDTLIFYRRLNRKNINELGYNELVVFNGTKKLVIDSIYNADKKITSSFSHKGELIVTTLNPLLNYYNESQDDFLRVYRVKTNAVVKDFIPCKYCSSGFISNRGLFYAKSVQRDKLSGGFSYTNIYFSNSFDLYDTVLVARNSKPLIVEENGRYILGERHFDLPNSPLAIFDTECNRYQLLLGRDYKKGIPFYSKNKKKFGFAFNDKIIYIDFPENYPFNSLNQYNPYTKEILKSNILKKLKQK